ncbi:MAG: uracil-DNA glycosylase, partial [Hyphomicrobiales bacterium]
MVRVGGAQRSRNRRDGDGSARSVARGCVLTTTTRPRHPDASPGDSLEALREEVIACRKCPRLVEWREKVAREKRAAFREWDYWGKPLPGFGDPDARVLVAGLAPAAHGGNRTGRIFTGDRSGDWVYASMYRTGFANQPTSTDAGDGLVVRGAYITAPVRCAPPDNRPTPQETANCAPYLEREFALLPNVRVIVALGAFALGAVARLTGMRPRPRFGHGAEFALPSGVTVLCSFHPSQRN